MNMIPIRDEMLFLLSSIFVPCHYLFLNSNFKVVFSNKIRSFQAVMI